MFEGNSLVSVTEEQRQRAKLEDYYCPNKTLNNDFVSGMIFDEVFITTYMQIWPCENTTTNDFSCDS